MDRPRRLRAAGAACAAALAALLLPGFGASQALGHAELVASSPGAGEVVAEAPTELILVFSEPLEPGFSSVDITGSTGIPVVADAGSVEEADRHQLRVELPQLDPGVYTVTWRSLSAADGHDASGFFSFGVGDVATAIPGGGVTHGAEDRDWPTAAGRWIGYLGLLTGLGLPVIALTVLRRPLRAVAVRLLAGLLVISGLAVLAMALWSAATTSGTDIGTYLLGSRNGSLQLARAVVMAGGGAAVWLVAGRQPRVASTLSAGASLVAIVLLALSGHAAGLPGAASAVNQVVHVAAVAIWLGGVGTLLACAMAPGLLADRVPGLREMVPRFSAMAVASIGLVGATGFYASWRQTGALLDIGTPYGTVLLIKIGLAVLALAIGALNYFDAGRGLHLVTGLRPRLTAELSAGAAVLLATGFLSITPPVEGARGVPVQPVPDAFGSVLPGMTMELTPGRPGVNQVTVMSAGALGTAPLELVLDRLDGGSQATIPLRHVGGPGMPDMPGMQHGGATGGPTNEGEDQWVADAVVLPADSTWNATVRILDEPGGTELSRQRYTFALDADSVAAGRVASLLDVGFGFAALLLLGGAIAVGLGIGGMRLPRCDPRASRIALAGGGTVGVLLGLVIGLERLLAIG